MHFQCKNMITRQYIKDTIHGDDENDFSLGAAKAYITRNEYNKALEHENYQFHFWLLKERMLAVLDRNKVIDTAPKDTKEGSWNKFTVPYMAFQDEFKKV